MWQLLVLLAACNGGYDLDPDDMYDDCASASVDDDAGAGSSLSDVRDELEAAPWHLTLDWNEGNAVGADAVEVTITPSAFASADAERCENGDGEVLMSAPVELVVGSDGWIGTGAMTDGVLQIQGGETTVMGSMEVSIAAYAEAAQAAVEDAAGMTVDAADVPTTAIFSVEHYAYYDAEGGSIVFQPEQLEHLYTDCETQECVEQGLTVTLASTTHELAR